MFCKNLGFQACQYNAVDAKQNQVQTDDPVNGHKGEPWITDHQAAKYNTDNIHDKCKIIAKASCKETNQSKV